MTLPPGWFTQWAEDPHGDRATLEELRLLPDRVRAAYDLCTRAEAVLAEIYAGRGDGDAAGDLLADLRAALQPELGCPVYEDGTPVKLGKGKRL